MPRTLLVLILLLSLTTPALSESPSAPARADHAITSSLAPHTRCAARTPSVRSSAFPAATAQTCCKICHKGKPAAIPASPAKTSATSHPDARAMDERSR